MLIALIIVNIFCGVVNTILGTSDRPFNAFVAVINWVAVGFLFALALK